MPSQTPFLAQKEATTSTAKDDIITLALGLLITHKNASLSLNVTRKLTWPSSRNGTIFAPTAIERNNFNRDADARIVRLGIEAGLWEDSLEAGRIGIRAIEEYIIREERNTVNERLKATSGTLMGMAEKLGRCDIDNIDNGVGCVGLGELWRGIEEELKSALGLVQEYAQSRKNFETNFDADRIKEDVVDVRSGAGGSAWNREDGDWGSRKQADSTEDYGETWDEETSITGNSEDVWIDENQTDQEWTQDEQEKTTPVNGWGDDRVSGVEMDFTDAHQYNNDWAERIIGVLPPRQVHPSWGDDDQNPPRDQTQRQNSDDWGVPNTTGNEAADDSWTASNHNCGEQNSNGWGVQNDSDQKDGEGTVHTPNGNGWGVQSNTGRGIQNNQVQEVANNTWDASNENSYAAQNYNSWYGPQAPHGNIPSWTATNQWACPAPRANHAGFRNDQYNVDCNGNRFSDTNAACGQNSHVPCPGVNSGWGQTVSNGWGPAISYGRVLGRQVRGFGNSEPPRVNSSQGRREATMQGWGGVA